MTMRRHERQGLLAINPRALSAPFPLGAGSGYKPHGNVSLVVIRGFLEQCKGSKDFDSYEAVLERVDLACAASESTVVLRINSPGGEVYGCFDTARAIRARCDAAGKRLIAYVDGDACSAAYAIACVCSEIVVGDTSFVGSIGVVETRIDLSVADAAQGVRYQLTTSGERKADMHAHAALTEAELASAQQRVDSLAGVFFELVAARRPSLSVDAVRALQAGIFHGAAAVAAGLADRVASFDACMALLAGGEGNTMADENEETPKAGNLDDARAALEKAAEGDGPDAEVAKAALKVLGGTASDADEETEPEATSEATEGDGDGDEETPPKPKPAAARSTTSHTLAATVQQLSAKVERLEAEKAANVRKALFASRPDLSPELIASLKNTPTEEARGILASIPVGTARTRAAASSVTGTRGVDQTGDAHSDAPPSNPYVEQLDAAFGTNRRAAISRTGSRKTFGVMSVEDARAAQAASAGKGGAK